MRNSKETIRFKRFESAKSANDFAKQVKGKVNDLTSNENRKSDFKVSYTKGNSQQRDFSKSERICTEEFEDYHPGEEDEENTCGGLYY